MTKFVVNHAAGLFLPGAEVPSRLGEEVEADTKNAAVAGWVEAGLLVKPKDFAKPTAPSADPATKAALDQALLDLEDRDKTITELTAKVDALTADLAAATKPTDQGT